MTHFTLFIKAIPPMAAKVFGLAITVSALLATVGCETTGALVGASKKGVGALNCNEIYNTFQAYDRDKQSVEAAKVLSSALGIPYVGGSGTEFYNTAKASANIALLSQGCNPL
jgi:hypothetical protein